MKVVLICKSDSDGGAAIATKRIANSLFQKGIDVSILVQEKKSNHNLIFSTTHSFLKRLINFVRFAFEKFIFYLKENDPSDRFSFSIANFGEDISKNKIVKNADIIHLHWINGGFLSLKSLKKLFSLKKPVVWTFHDMWAFTGGCHVADDCINFKNTCGSCKFLKNPHEKDLSNQIWSRKKSIYDQVKINTVTCSNWLRKLASESSLMRGMNVQTIQNPINTDVFKPKNKSESKQKFNIKSNKKLVLFGAMYDNKRKGSRFLIDALEYISKNNKEIIDDIALVVFGKNKIEFSSDFEIINLNLITNQEDIVNVYNACDIFVTPSLIDNLPNTVVEAHACGLPVVAFNCTGLTEMIDHKQNGYLASFKSSKDLAMGIIWTLFNSDYDKLSMAARNKAINTYSQDISASKYIELYKSLINPNE